MAGREGGRGGPDLVALRRHDARLDTEQCPAFATDRQ